MSERVRVSLRVPERVKEAYEDAIHEKYGVKRPYAGTELEQEIRIALGLGEDSSMFESLRDMASEKKSSEASNAVGMNTAGEVGVYYRIHEDVRAKLKHEAAKVGSPAGALLAKIMRGYANGEGYYDKMNGYVQDLEEDDPDDDLSATERKERDIAEYLKENHGKEDVNRGEFVAFSVGDFDEAAKEAADLSTKRHAREQYLKPVMDRLEVIPTSSGKYLPETSSAEADPRGLPYEVMTEAEKRTVLKTEAIEKGKAGTRTGLTVSEGVKALGGSPRKRDVKRLLETISENVLGFEYRNPDRDDVEPFLAVTQDVTATTNNKETALKLTGLLEEDEDREDVDDVQDVSENYSQNRAVVAD